MPDKTFRVGGTQYARDAPSSTGRFKVTKVRGGNYVVQDKRSHAQFVAVNGLEEVKAIEGTVGVVDGLMREPVKGEGTEASATLVWDDPAHMPRDLARFRRVTIDNPHADLAVQLMNLGQLIAAGPMGEGAKLALKAYILGRTVKPEWISFANTL